MRRPTKVYKNIDLTHLSPPLPSLGIFVSPSVLAVARSDGGLPSFTLFGSDDSVELVGRLELGIMATPISVPASQSW